MQEKFSICVRKILKVVGGISQSIAISTPNYQSFPLPIIKIRVRQMDRKSQTALLIGKCDHCLRSPHKLKFAGTPFPLAKS